MAGLGRGGRGALLLKVGKIINFEVQAKYRILRFYFGGF